MRDMPIVLSIDRTHGPDVSRMVLLRHLLSEPANVPVFVDYERPMLSELSDFDSAEVLRIARSGKSNLMMMASMFERYSTRWQAIRRFVDDRSPAPLVPTLAALVGR